MKRTAAVTLAAFAGIAALASLALASGIAKRVAKRALGGWNSRKRLAMRVVDRPLAHLALSQVGYSPSMLKQFTSARSFGGFQVVSERDGAVAFAGGAPVRTVKTDILGAIDTVWIGDFSALSAAGRYRIVGRNADRSVFFQVRVGVSRWSLG